jgi:hypothetical protein
MSDRDVIDIYEPIYYPDGKSDWSASKDSFEDVHGESDNYEEVPAKDKQGRLIANFNDIR